MYNINIRNQRTETFAKVYHALGQNQVEKSHEAYYMHLKLRPQYEIFPQFPPKMKMVENRTLEESLFVILNKHDYGKRIKDKVEKGLYRKIRICFLYKTGGQVIRECQPILGENRLKVYNPALFTVKGIPKIYRSDKGMRE